MDDGGGCLAPTSPDVSLLYAFVFWDQTFGFYGFLSVFTIPSFAPYFPGFGDTQPINIYQDKLNFVLYITIKFGLQQRGSSRRKKQNKQNDKCLFFMANIQITERICSKKQVDYSVNPKIKRTKVSEQSNKEISVSAMANKAIKIHDQMGLDLGLGFMDSAGKSGKSTLEIGGGSWLAGAAKAWLLHSGFNYSCLFTFLVGSYPWFSLDLTSSFEAQRPINLFYFIKIKIIRNKIEKNNFTIEKTWFVRQNKKVSFLQDHKTSINSYLPQIMA